MALRRAIEAFWADRRGNVAIIVGLVFVPMIAMAGGATDLARYETFRVALQDSIDRGVLAAASMSQTKSSQDTVRDYIANLSFAGEVELSVDEDVALNGKRVSARAVYDMPTAFLPLLGIETLPVAASATAEEGRQNIEISLVLDFSGSMAGNKFTRLKVAAKEFIDSILAGGGWEQTSIAIVPYSGQVNVGAAMYDTIVNVEDYPLRRSHSHSSCFLMDKTADYATGLLDFASHPQIPHFTVWNSVVDKPTLPANMGPAWCPSEETSIVYPSNDASYLKGKIDAFRMYDGTGSGIAINYGYMLLDPDARSLLSTANVLGKMDDHFVGRPADFNDAETVKFIVLMTDGAITEQYTAKDPTLDVRTDGNATQTTSRPTNRDWLYKVCDTARNNGVTVFTIGFETAPGDAAEMRNCATTPDHYYSVSGLQINDAFRQIASSINKIKLTR